MAEPVAIGDVLAFLETLPSGFATGPREQLAVREMLLRLLELGELPADRQRWKTLIAPLVCGNEEQQAEFYSRFQARLAVAEPKKPDVPEKPPRRWRREAIAAAFLLVLLGGAGWRLQQLFGPVPNPPMPPAPAFLVPLEKKPVPATTDVLYAAQVRTSEGLPLRGATVWAPADRAAAQPRTVLTGAEGRFRIQMGAGPFRVLVVHPDYEPAYIEQAQAEIRVGPLRAARRVLTLNPGQTVRRYPLWLSLTLAAIPFLGALAVLWWNEQRRAKFASFEAELDLKPVTVHSRSEEDKLFERVDVAALARELRKRRPEPTGQLAAEATILRTAARAGLFTPVKLERKVGREYLVLVERKSGRDQQARFWACLLDRLAGRGVWLDRYFFAGDPRVCEAAGGERAWVGLPELAALHPRHELWVLAASERFFDSITREPAPWLKALARWPERAVVRLTTGSAEDEVQLRDLGFAVTLGSVAGLAGLEDQQVAEEYLAPYPLALEDSEARWMPGAPPATDKEVRSLLRQLRAWLGGNGYRCLLASAVYPALAWNLTLHLALHLIPADREETLARLVRLPWFRHGRIPEWLRVALVRELKESEAKRVLELLRGFVAHKSTPAAGESGGLELVKPGAGTAAKRKRDYVYLSFLYGRKPDPRDLEAPGWLKRLL